MRLRLRLHVLLGRHVGPPVRRRLPLLLLRRHAEELLLSSCKRPLVPGVGTWGRLCPLLVPRGSLLKVLWHLDPCFRHGVL